MGRWSGGGPPGQHQEDPRNAFSLKMCRPRDCGDGATALGDLRTGPRNVRNGEARQAIVESPA